MANFDQFISSLRQQFGEQGAGKKFEVFCKWFLENDPEWSKIVDKVWLWEEYPNKWQSKELGTDLVFKDKDSQIWAVQSKCYSPHRGPNTADVGKFLGDSGRSQVFRRLWMQTTNKMTAEAKSMLANQEKKVTILDLNFFQSAQIEYPTSFTDLYKAKVKDKHTPEPYQYKAIRNITAGFETLDRCQMIMACGTGKTLTTLWIKEALNARKTLVLLPSLSLLSQTMREWAWAGNSDFDILNVCSDKTVGKKTEDMKPTDAPFAVTSEIGEIASFLKKSGPRVVFCTYQSSQLIADAQSDREVPAFDLAIADEAHRCAGKVDTGFSIILDKVKIKANKRLFTTATPRYFGKAIKNVTKEKDHQNISMDDEKLFGPVIHKLTFGKAIQDGLLNNYQVVIVGVDEPMVKQWIDNYEIVSTSPGQITDARTLAAKIGILKAIKDYDLKRIISFHSRVSGAKKFSEELIDVLNLIEPANQPKGLFLSDYVSGKMKTGDRKNKIDRLKGLEGYDRGILANARCLAEGVDIPSLNGIAFIDPKGSQIEIIQAVGRAIRKDREAEAQTKGTIVIPVFIADNDDHETSIENSNFKPVWDVLKALRAHDEVLAETLDNYRTSMAKCNFSGNNNLGDNIIFDIPTSIDNRFSIALKSILVEASTSSWEFWFGLLEIFWEREGHSLVPQNHVENRYKLGNWVSTVRGNKNHLEAKKLHRLKNVGFIWDPISYWWKEGYRHLKTFQKREKHCLVPGGFNESGYNLGTWVNHQRAKKNFLSKEQINQMDSIGFIWNVLDYQWELGFKYLQIFQKREKHCLVPTGFKENGYNLQEWVRTQRSNKKGLSENQLNRLNNIGFVWNVPDYQWELGFKYLQIFQKREKHCLVPTGFKENGFNLGTWVKNQRRNKEKLDLKKLKLMNTVGFIWNVPDYEWEIAFKQLMEFEKREGHCDVRYSYNSNGFNLGSWVNRQRNKKEQLDSNKINKLNSINFKWIIEDDIWELSFNLLSKYVMRHGNARVPVKYVEKNFKLGQWVSIQRSHKSKLDKCQIDKLNSLGFVWSVAEERWDKGFKHLQIFHMREKHCLVPMGHKENNFDLHGWVKRRRLEKKRLGSEKVDLLNSMGFIWDVLIYQWEEGFNYLLKFKEREGHSVVPTHHKENDFALGQWVSVQRKTYRRGKLDLERRKRLETLDFTWKAN